MSVDTCWSSARTCGRPSWSPQVRAGRRVVAPLHEHLLDLQVEAGHQVAGDRVLADGSVVELLRRTGAIGSGVGAEQRRVRVRLVRATLVRVELPTRTLALGDEQQVGVAEQLDVARVAAGAGEHGAVELADEVDVLLAARPDRPDEVEVAAVPDRGEPGRSGAPRLEHDVWHR